MHVLCTHKALKTIVWYALKYAKCRRLRRLCESASRYFFLHLCLFVIQYCRCSLIKLNLRTMWPALPKYYVMYIESNRHCLWKNRMNVDLVEKLDSCTYSIRRIPNTQSCNRRPLCSTFTFENLRSPKKTSFIPKKIQKKFKK